MQSAIKKPELCIVAGPNGSGKTTVTKTLLRHEWGSTCHYINPDELANVAYDGWNDHASIHRAAVECQRQRYEDLQSGRDIVFETVMSSPEKLEFIRLAKEKGYFVRLFFICTDSPAINAMRIADRVLLGGHSVPIDRIISRYYRSLANLDKVITEVDRCYLYDNTVDNALPELVFRTDSGMIEKIYKSEMPLWLNDIFIRLRALQHRKSMTL